MNTNGVFTHTAALSGTRLNAKVLKEGSSVLVRIIADRGGGRYEGSVAGVRVSLTSRKTLVPGQSFVAEVSSKNGTVFVTPRDSAPMALSGGMEALCLDSAQVMAYLSELGLAGDEVSVRMFQFMRQLGMKFSPALLNKIHSMALKFPGKEKKAAVLLQLLAQKGCEASEEELERLLDELDAAGLDYMPGEDRALFAWEELSPGDLSQFFAGLLSGSDNDAGLLTVMNHLGSADVRGNGSWVLIPFEILKAQEAEGFSPDSLDRIGGGSMRFFLNSEKKLKKLNLFVDFFKKDFIFSLDFVNNICKAVKVGTDFTADGDAFFEAVKKRLEERFPGVGVERVERDLLEDFSAGLEEILVLGGEA